MAEGWTEHKTDGGKRPDWLEDGVTIIVRYGWPAGTYIGPANRAIWDCFTRSFWVKNG
jgi:hypothetical protein